MQLFFSYSTSASSILSHSRYFANYRFYVLSVFTVLLVLLNCQRSRKKYLGDVQDKILICTATLNDNKCCPLILNPTCVSSIDDDQNNFDSIETRCMHACVNQQSGQMYSTLDSVSG